MECIRHGCILAQEKRYWPFLRVGPTELNVRQSEAAKRRWRENRVVEVDGRKAYFALEFGRVELFFGEVGTFSHCADSAWSLFTSVKCEKRNVLYPENQLPTGQFQVSFYSFSA